MTKRNLKKLVKKPVVKIAGTLLAVGAIAGLVYGTGLFVKQHQHKVFVTGLQQQIATTKPVTKLVKPSETFKTSEKGYTFAVTKESNTKDPVTFQAKNGSIAFASYASQNLGDINATTAKQQGDKTVYENIYNGVNLIYTNYPDRTLEEYEVKVRRPITQIVQQIDTTEVIYKNQPDGSIEFFNKTTGEFSFAIPRPVMYEAQNTRARSYGLHFEVVQANGKTYLVKVIDQTGQQWLQNASYPVMIDATVSLTLFGYESYPSQNNVWQVRLDTVGQGNLGIKTDSPNIQLQSLTCGTQNVNISNGTVPNFTCSDATIATFKVLDNEQHNVTFTYSGFSTTVQSAPNATKPTILSATANPPVVHVGDNVTVSSHIIDPVGIASVSADMGGIETIQLNKNSGSSTDGTWQAVWNVYNTKPISYPITITATNVNGQKEVSNIAFFDPVSCTTGGDYAGGNFTPAVDCPGGFNGAHTNIGTFAVNAGQTASLLGWNGTTQTGSATVSATTVTIAATGTLTGTGKGKTGGGQFGSGNGTGAGIGCNGNGSGAGYGGDGGAANCGAGGSPYGSYLVPIDVGSGGGGGANGASVGGTGGGAFQLRATGTMTVNGTLVANGNDGAANGGGGSGGSIYLVAGTLTGSGIITANGGNGVGVGGTGNGGGGRIAIYYTTANTFTGSAPTVNAGTTASDGGLAGTSVLIDSTNNDLYISTSQTWKANPVLEGQTFTYRNITVSNNATWTLYGFNTNGTNGVGQSFSTTNFTITSGSSVLATNGYAGGGQFASGTGPGAGIGCNGNGSGAGYGGTGGASNCGAGGSTYGSATVPIDLGSGGGGGANGASIGGRGGGAIKIFSSGTLTIGGILAASGSAGLVNGGGGSGGSIYLLAATLTGGGSIAAPGGNGVAASTGNGGGGRIAIYYGTNSWAGNTLTAASATPPGTGGLNGSNGTVNLFQKFLPVISSFNQFQSNCTTPVATGGSVTSTTACIGVTITDGDNPDTETIDLEIEPNGTPFTNIPTQTISGVAMAGSPVSRTQTETVVLGQSYHWQARITDSLGFTTGWTARGGNPDFLSQVQAPDSVTATYVSDTSITVSWVYTGAAVDGFDVERSTDGAAFQVINSNVAYPTSSLSDTTATANHEYIYRVRAFLGVNNSVYTTASNVDTTPAAPTSVTVTQPHVGTFTITWTDNANDESNYEIQRQIGSGSFVALSTTLAANTTTYTDTQVQENQVYTYRVRATRTTPNALQSSFGTAAGTTPTLAFGKGIYLTAAGRLVLENDVVNSVDIFKNVQNDSSNKIGQDVSYDSTHPANGPVFPAATTINDLTVKEGFSQVDGKSDIIYVGTNNGLFAIHENATTPANGAIKVYTKDYISELMIGDTRGMWPLDSGFGSGLPDVTSHAQTLTNNGTTTFTASGVRGQAATFNGTTQFLSIADNANLSITGSLTLNAWFKTTSTSTAQTILAKNGSYSIALTNTGTLQAQVIGATTATRTSTSVMDTGWHRATMVYDASGQTLTLYIDGKVDTGNLTGTVPASLTDSAGDFEIGANAGATFFSGNIDEVTVTATAATAAQVANAYQDGYRALQNHTSGKITGVTGADAYQQLLGGGTGGTTVNTVKAVRVDNGNQFIYVGTNDSVANTGGVSVIGTISDSVLDLYSTINTSKVDSLGNPFAANDIVAIGVAGTPNPASNGQTDVSNTIGVLSFAGTNDTATRVWMESQRFSLAQVLGATTGGGGDSNQVTVNNLLTVGNVLAPTASSSGENILIPAFQVNQQGNITANYTGTDPTGTVYTFTDGVTTTGNTFSLTGSALTSGTLLALSSNSLTTGTGINATFNGLTSGTGLNVTSSANNFIGNLANISLTGTTNSTGSALNVTTSATGNGNKAIAISSTGATSGINYGLYSAMTGAATTNIAGYFSSIGATNNYGLIVANGSVGIGTTTPTAALDIAGSASISGNLTFRGVNNIIAALGGAPLNFQTSPGGDAGLASRLYIANNGNIGFGTSNPANFFDVNSLFDVTSAGKVGINTTSPLATLDIRSILGTQATASISGKTSFAGLVVDNSGVGDLFTASSSGLNRFVITQNGNVGIGTTGPVGKLQITGGGIIVNGSGETITSSTSFTNPGGALGAVQMGYDTTNNKAVIRSVLWGTSFEPLYFQGNEYRWSTGAGSQAEKMVLDVNGNLGVGTTAPNALLSLGTAVQTNKLYMYDGTNDKYGFGIAANTLQIYSGAGGGVNATIAFGKSDGSGGGSNFTEFMRLLNGSLGINTTAPKNKLDVNGAVAIGSFAGVNTAASNALIVSGQTGIGTAIMLATLDVRSQNGTQATASVSGKTSFAGLVVDNSGLGDIFTASSSGLNRFVITQSGNVGIGTTNPDRMLTLDAGSGGWDNTLGGMLKLTSSTPVAVGITLNNTDVGGAVHGRAYTIGSVGHSAVAASGSFVITDTTAANADRLVIDPNGRIGINTEAPNFRLDVADSQAATVAAMISNTNSGANAGGLAIKLANTTPATTNYFETFLNGNGEIIGKIAGNGSNGVSFSGSGIDFAEYYKKQDASESAQPGDVMCLDVSGVTKCHGSSSNTIGVVSNTASFVGGGNHDTDPGYVLVGLIGQLKVKVATTSGEIFRGDPLTASAIPGVAVKATTPGVILGHAMTSSSESTDGTVMLALQVNWYDANFSGIASSSPVGAPANEALLGSDLPLSVNTATVSGTLTVLGRTTLSDLGVTGDITAGVISIHGMDGQIDNLAGDLQLQSQGLGGVNILAGKVVISTAGNMTVQGTITAQEVTTDKLNITTGQSGSTGILGASAGSVTILQNQMSVTISTNKLTPNSLIFITPDIPVSVAAKKTGDQTFQIILSSPAPSPIHVNWWIVN